MERRVLLAYRPLSRISNAVAPFSVLNWRFKRRIAAINRQVSSNPPVRRAGSPKPSSKPTSRPRVPANFTQDASAATLSVHAAKSFKTAEHLSSAILQQQNIPSEAQTVQALRAIEVAAKDSMNSLKPQPLQLEEENTPAAALLTLDPHSDSNTPNMGLTALKATDRLSSVAYKILAHPPVFISSATLEIYVQIQSILEKPSTIPFIFNLYATKPIPEPNSNPMRYKRPNAARISQAIPPATADLALECAINSPQRSLETAIGIIETSYRAPAFRRAKIFKRAVPPITIAAAAPVAAWTLASQLSMLQNSMDPMLMTQTAFAGILTYIVAVGSIGLVALTTANDQMQRVTWAVGLPLRERWIREEERAAVDRVALAWGFKQISRRGEEEGAEWEALRDWIGMQGMILDKVSLMEGMQ